MSDFQLDPRLEAGSEWVADLALCTLRLKDDARFPWLLLIPRRSEITEIYDLPPEDQRLMWEETTRMGKVLMRVCGGDKLNLGALGNVVPQFHMHLISRREGDAAWPGPVWGVGTSEPYLPERLEEILSAIRAEVA